MPQKDLQQGRNQLPEKIGASSSLLIATITLLSFMPAGVVSARNSCKP